MPTYRYAAKAADGRVINSLIIANDEALFFAEIKARSLYLISHNEVNQEGSMVLGKNKPLPLKDLTIFAQQTASLLKVGVSLVKAIDILYQQTTKKAMKNSIKLIYESVQKGNLLSESLRKQTGKYPNIMISLIEAGEASGMLAEAVDKIAKQFESDLKLKRKITSAMIYPAVLSVIGVGVVILMVTVVLPQFIKMFQDAGITELPLPTAMLIGLSDFVVHQWYYVIFAVMLIGIIFRLWVKSVDGGLAWDRFKFKVPISKQIMKPLMVVRFTRTFSTLISSGMPMLSALTIVMNVVGNKSVAAELAETSEDIRKGMALATAIRRVTIFPPVVVSMISIGEEAGSLETMLENAAGYFNDELENSIARMVTLIEPIMIVVMGGVVGFIILSIMLPMLQIYQSIG